MDIDQLAADMDMDPALYRELLALFIDTTGEEMAELSRALSQKDYGRISELAHSIKGAALSLGLNELAGQAENLESAAARKAQIEVESTAGRVRYRVEELARLL